MNLNVLIVDDEPLARRGIRARLKNYSGITIVDECADGESALEAIARLSPDLVFLDVQMPGMGGFEVLEGLGAQRPSGGQRLPSIIFLTAYDHYAVRAFEVHALDYLLKPIDDERFAIAVERARRQIRLETAGALEDRLRGLLNEVRLPPLSGAAADRSDARIGSEGIRGPSREPRPFPTEFAERFAVRTGSHITFVTADEIDWIEASGDYAGLHVGKKTLLLRQTLSKLESRLDPARFVRIHRSTIVQATRIRDLESLPNREFRIRLLDGKILKASRSYRDRLDRWLK